MLPELARGLKEKVVKYFGVENIWSNASEMIVRTRDMDVFFRLFGCSECDGQISNAYVLNRFTVSLACSFWDPLTYGMLTERWSVWETIGRSVWP